MSRQASRRTKAAFCFSLLVIAGVSYSQSPELTPTCLQLEDQLREIDEIYIPTCETYGDCGTLEILRNDIVCGIGACWDLVDGVCSLY